MGSGAHVSSIWSALRLAPTSVVFFSVLSCAGSDDPEQEGPSATYCEARDVLDDKCVRCHSQSGDVSTPFSLETFEQVSERATAVRRVTSNGTMPPTSLFDLDPPVEDLTAEETQVLVSWIDAGAPAEDCD